MLSFLITSCEKDYSPKELNIKYISAKKDPIENTDKGNYTSISYAIAPNPFETNIQFSFSPNYNNEIIELFITDSKGDYKKLRITESEFNLDFSAEEDGSYYCEVRIGDHVFQDHLLKRDQP
jgi:hypothetical protein